MLVQAKTLTSSQREAMVQLVVVSVFRYSAALVPWTTTELDGVSNEWRRAYRGVWNLPRGADSSLICLGRRDGGRGCPTAQSIWISETASLIGQCMRVPGLVARLMIENLQRTCLERGCLTLYQLQRMLRLGSRPRNWVEMLASRLDDLGLDITGEFWRPQIGRAHV